jgi:predicted nucleotidyltransferase
MTPVLPPLVQRTLARFVRAFAPERILLFGSYAKGATHTGSDVDLLIIADLPGNSSVHLRRAHQLAYDCFPRVDIVFATPREVAAADSAKSPFLSSILGTGIEVYRRADDLSPLPASQSV